MKVEQKLEALEGELKLIKGEFKETLVDVREFLEDVDSSGDDGHSPTNLAVLEEKIERMREGLELILLDIRALLMEAGSPLRSNLQAGRQSVEAKKGGKQP